MTQTRVVLPPEHREKADQILEATGISTYSQLITILLVTYGDRLVNSLKEGNQ